MRSCPDQQGISRISAGQPSDHQHNISHLDQQSATSVTCKGIFSTNRNRADKLVIPHTFLKLQGVWQNCTHFVFVNFSASLGARIKIFDIFEQLQVCILGAVHKLRHPFLDHFRHPHPPVIMSSFGYPPSPPLMT